MSVSDNTQQADAGAGDGSTTIPVRQEQHDLRRQALRNPGVRALITSRFATSLGLATLVYGSMVYLATIGASQAAISLVGATRFLSALLFGISGGALADVMSKRSALVVAYSLQGAACFIVPAIWGASVSSLVALVFVEAALGQIAIPAIKSATALVSTAAQVAVVAAIIAVAGGLGAAMGSAFLAPILINFSSIQTIIYVSGIILLLGAWRAWRLPPEKASPSSRQRGTSIGAQPSPHSIVRRSGS